MAELTPDELKLATEETDDAAMQSDTVYAKKKEMTEEEKADELARQERELGDFKAEGFRQAIFILLDEPESGTGAKVMSFVLMAIIFLSCCSFIIETHPSISCKGFAQDGQCLLAALPGGPGGDNAEFDLDCVRGDEAGNCASPSCNITLTPDECLCVTKPECEMGDCPLDTSQLCVAQVDSEREWTASENAQYALERRTGLHYFEAFCIICFTIEFVARTATCTARPRTDRGFWKYVLKPLNLIDVLAIAPWYYEKAVGGSSSLSILRILRMTRIFRVVKAGGALGELQLFIEGYKRAREGLLLLFFLLFLYLCVFAALLYLLEYDAKTIDCFGSCMVDDLGNDLEMDGRTGADICFYDVEGDGSELDDVKVVASDTWSEDHPVGLGTVPGEIGAACDACGCLTRGFTSIPTTWYFIMATMTTVGYGDHYPLTVGGRIVCGFCMLCGIMVLALPIIVIGNAFEEVFAEEKRHKAEKARRLALKKLEREITNGTASKELQAKMDEINAEAKRKSSSILDITTCVHTTSSLLEKLNKDCDDPRFAKALQEVLRD
jgi:hypothetical protein